MLKICYKNCLLIIFMVLALSVSSSGQTEIGMRTGVFFAKFRYFANDEQYAHSETINGGEVGIIAKIPLWRGLSLQQEINFLQKGGEIIKPSLPAKTIINQVEFAPAMRLQHKIGKISLFAYGGLFYGCFINGKTTDEDHKEVLEFEKPRLRRSDFGYLTGGGIGLKLGKGYLFLESRYRHSLIYLSKTGTDITELSVKNSGIGAYIGYQASFKVIKTRF